MELLETAASDPANGDERSLFRVAKSVANTISFFFPGGRRANKWSRHRKGNMICSVSGWGKDRTRSWSQREVSTLLICRVTSDGETLKIRVLRDTLKLKPRATILATAPGIALALLPGSQ